MTRRCVPILAAPILAIFSVVLLGSLVASADGPRDRLGPRAGWSARPDHRPGARPAEFDRSAPRPASVGASAVATVTGRVLDDAGSPISGTLVFAFPETGTQCPVGSSPPVPTPSATPPAGDSETTLAISAADGSFTLRLNEGYWFLAADDPAHVSILREARSVVIGPGGLSDLELRLQRPTSALVGTVRDPSGTPVVSGTVALYGYQDDENIFQSSAAIDAQGRYTAPIVPASWDVEVVDHGAGPDALPVGRESIAVTSTATTTVDLQLIAATSTISGMVQNQAGGPVAEAVVGGFTDVTTDTHAFQFTIAGTDGSFALPVNAGAWELFAAQDDPIALDGYEVTAPVSGTISGNLLTLPYATHCIQGSVRKATGDPALPGSYPEVFGETSVPGQSYRLHGFAVLDSDSSYSLPVVTGTWTIQAGEANESGIGFSYSLTRTAAVPPNATGLDLQIRPSEILTPVLYLMALARSGAGPSGGAGGW